MQIAAATAPSTTTTTSPTAGPVAAAVPAERNPWGFPELDRRVAQQALDGLEAAVRVANRLIDRSIAVRVQLDRDLGAGTWSPDTVKAVELLARARDYARDTLDRRHLPRELQRSVHAWIRDNAGDQRIRVVSTDISRIDRAVTDLLDDDEGNVRDEIVTMRQAPGRRAWQAVRDALDGGIAALYDARDIGASQHVLRAAGGLR